ACLDDVSQLVKTQLCLQKHMLDKNQLLWQINNKHLERLTKYYHDLITDSNSRMVVLEDTDSGQLIGTGLGRICFHDGYIPERSGEIDNIWVAATHRKKGFCKTMVSSLLDFFKLHRIESVTLKWAVGNYEAESTWLAFGFKPVLAVATATLSEIEGNLRQVPQQPLQEIKTEKSKSSVTTI
ncbi:MAG: GNAT family N-acetyltransferase, partial [Planctomycetes bacterium]|nr:GNAT family N-acetyltransferase [Planctomycetota bacterium]